MKPKHGFYYGAGRYRIVVYWRGYIIGGTQDASTDRQAEWVTAALSFAQKRGTPEDFIEFVTGGK